MPSHGINYNLDNMNEYRLLTEEEIGILEDNGCRSGDWTSVNVAEDFVPAYVRNVVFYGNVNLGVFEKNIEVSKGFFVHSGLRNAVLRNVTVGDNCLIENIGNFINNYVIGDECYISNVCLMETTEEATFGEGNMISVLDEAGSGNVVLFCGLTSNLAALMVEHAADRDFMAALRKMIKEDIDRRVPCTGTIGDNVKIVNTSEITNTHIASGCEVNGACRLSDCTLNAEPGDFVYIGSGVICENSIVSDSSVVLDGAKIDGCYVGEACQISNGFSAVNSVFFANTYMSNGEACAAFCGPFSVSHHKSTLLIGGMFSFYNAGSGTNFSNHAYKMGPVHYGKLGRGTKTASGSHILFPATIGAFSMCMGKISSHPDTSGMPFSYVIADGKDTYIVPGRNITTVGLFRDTRKWRRRDMRVNGSKKSVINLDWLNPVTAAEMMQGLKTLESLQKENSDDAGFCVHKGCKIKKNALLKGIRLYSMGIEMFIGKVLAAHHAGEPCGVTGAGQWNDLSGLLLPSTVEENIVNGIKQGFTPDIPALFKNFSECECRYNDYVWTFTVNLIKTYLGVDELFAEDIDSLRAKADEARREWINDIRSDAEKEFGMGDVEESVLNKFMAQLDEYEKECHPSI